MKGLILETKTVRYKKHAEDKKNKHFYVLVSCPTPIYSKRPLHSINSSGYLCRPIDKCTKLGSYISCKCFMNQGKKSCKKICFLKCE